MKKSYVKPQVYFENFQLSTNIAGECGTDREFFGNHSTGDVCTWIGDEPNTVFTQSNTGCYYKPNSEGKICYDIPLSANRIFGS